MGIGAAALGSFEPQHHRQLTTNTLFRGPDQTRRKAEFDVTITERLRRASRPTHRWTGRDDAVYRSVQPSASAVASEREGRAAKTAALEAPGPGSRPRDHPALFPLSGFPHFFATHPAPSARLPSPPLNQKPPSGFTRSVAGVGVIRAEDAARWAHGSHGTRGKVREFRPAPWLPRQRCVAAVARSLARNPLRDPRDRRNLRSTFAAFRTAFGRHGLRMVRGGRPRLHQAPLIRVRPRLPPREVVRRRLRPSRTRDGPRHRPRPPKP